MHFDSVDALDMEIMQISALFVNVAGCQLAVIDELLKQAPEKRECTQVPVRLRAKLATNEVRKSEKLSGDA